MRTADRRQAISLGITSIADIIALTLSFAGFQQVATIGLITVGRSRLLFIASQQWRYERQMTQAERSTFLPQSTVPHSRTIHLSRRTAKIMSQPDIIFLLLVTAALGLGLLLRIRQGIEQIQAKGGSFAPLYLGFALILALGVAPAA